MHRFEYKLIMFGSSHSTGWQLSTCGKSCRQLQ